MEYSRAKRMVDMALAQKQTKAWGMYSGAEMEEEKDAFKVSPEEVMLNDDDDDTDSINKLFKNVEDILVMPQNNVYETCMNEEANLSKDYGPPNEQQHEFLKPNEDLLDFHDDEKLNAFDFTHERDDPEMLLDLETPEHSGKTKKLSKADRIDRDRKKQPLLPGSCKCISGYKNNFEECVRQEIHDKFCKLTYNARKNMIFSMVTKEDVKRPRNITKGNRKRKFTYKYGFKKNGISISVCQRFFLDTISFKDHQVIQTALKEDEVVTINPTNDKI